MKYYRSDSKKIKAATCILLIIVLLKAIQIYQVISQNTNLFADTSRKWHQVIYDRKSFNQLTIKSLYIIVTIKQGLIIMCVLS